MVGEGRTKDWTPSSFVNTKDTLGGHVGLYGFWNGRHVRVGSSCLDLVSVNGRSHKDVVNRCL